MNVCYIYGCTTLHKRVCVCVCETRRIPPWHRSQYLYGRSASVSLPSPSQLSRIPSKTTSSYLSCKRPPISTQLGHQSINAQLENWRSKTFQADDDGYRGEKAVAWLQRRRYIRDNRRPAKHFTRKNCITAVGWKTIFSVELKWQLFSRRETETDSQSGGYTIYRKLRGFCRAFWAEDTPL